MQLLPLFSFAQIFIASNFHSRFFYFVSFFAYLIAAFFPQESTLTVQWHFSFTRQHTFYAPPICMHATCDYQLLLVLLLLSHFMCTNTHTHTHDPYDFYSLQWMKNNGMRVCAKTDNNYTIRLPVRECMVEFVILNVVGRMLYSIAMH